MNTSFVQTPETIPKTPAAEPKRMSISLTSDVVEQLRYLSETQGVSQNEAIRKAIATETYFLKERQTGGTVLIQKSDKQIREVIFR